MQLMWIIDKEAFAYLVVTLGIKTPSRMDEEEAIFSYVKEKRHSSFIFIDILQQGLEIDFSNNDNP